MIRYLEEFAFSHNSLKELHSYRYKVEEQVRGSHAIVVETVMVVVEKIAEKTSFHRRRPARQLD